MYSVTEGFFGTGLGAMIKAAECWVGVRVLSSR